MRCFIVAAISMAALFARPLPAEVIDRIVAVVNDEAITLYELEQAYARDMKDLSVAAGRDLNISRTEYLDKMIGQVLLEQEVQRQGINISELELKKSIDEQQERLGMDDEQFEAALKKEGLSMEKYKERLREQMIMVRLVGQEVRSEVKVTDQEIEAYYSNNKERFQTPPRVHLRHIFLPYPTSGGIEKKKKVRSEIESIRSKIEDGADFASMARKYSKGPSASKGGDLGWFEISELLDSFQEQVEKLEVGQTSPVFEEAPGFHLLFLQEMQPGKPMPLEQLREDIKDQIYQKKVMERYELWLERLKAQSHIEVRYQG